jgi:hypothetical protein
MSEEIKPETNPPEIEPDRDGDFESKAPELRQHVARTATRIAGTIEEAREQWERLRSGQNRDEEREEAK